MLSQLRSGRRHISLFALHNPQQLYSGLISNTSAWPRLSGRPLSAQLPPSVFHVAGSVDQCRPHMTCRSLSLRRLSKPDPSNDSTRVTPSQLILRRHEVESCPAPSIAPPPHVVRVDDREVWRYAGARVCLRRCISGEMREREKR